MNLGRKILVGGLVLGLLTAVVLYSTFSAETPIARLPLTTSEFSGNFGYFNRRIWHMPRKPGCKPENKRLYLESAEEPCFPQKINYRDFEMFFHLQLENSGGASWALRLNDSSHYYLFYLSGPEGLYPNSFVVYVVRGDFDWSDHSEVAKVPEAIKLREGGTYAIDILVKENVFTTRITSSDTGEERELLTFKDSGDTFSTGSIGFRTVSSEKFSIGTLRVIPPEVPGLQ